MKKLLSLFLVCMLAFTFVQTTTFAAPNPNNTEVANEDDDFDWGWIGLLGLVGLMGLRRNDERRDK